MKRSVLTPEKVGALQRPPALTLSCARLLVVAARRFPAFHSLPLDSHKTRNVTVLRPRSTGRSGITAVQQDECSCQDNRHKEAYWQWTQMGRLSIRRKNDDDHEAMVRT